MPRRPHSLKLDVLAQPDEFTCGPTSLHAVYGYFGDDIPLERVISEVAATREAGTLAVVLANHALQRGYQARIFTYDLQVFDPTWFTRDLDLAERLRAQLRHKRERRLSTATRAYLEFLELGGVLSWEELRPGLIRRFLARGVPILTGLSATYLYDCARETEEAYDDVGGEPQGHFVVLSGYEPRKRRVRVADPLQDNPRFRSRYYSVGMDRLISAILLGIVTYDANLLVLTPPELPRPKPQRARRTLPTARKAPPSRG